MANAATFVLTDAEARAREAPYTFFRPSSAELAAISKGDLVKLIFELVPPGKTYDAERMWVSVTDAGAESLSGVLDNDPYEARLAAGDAVTFERRHVISIQWADPANAPPGESRREYWERCMVDDVVVTGERPVEYIYREEPDLASEDDRYPDSGWRIRGRRLDEVDEDIDNRKAQYVALGAILNRDDSWLHLIDSPTGSAFMRDFETNVYVPTRE